MLGKSYGKASHEILQSGSHAVASTHRPTTPADATINATSWGISTQADRIGAMTTRGLSLDRKQGPPHSRGNPVLSIEGKYKTVMGLSYRDPTNIKEVYCPKPQSGPVLGRAARTKDDDVRRVDYDSTNRRHYSSSEDPRLPHRPQKPSVTQQIVTPRNRRVYRKHPSIQHRPTPGYTGCRPQTAR